MSDTRIPRFLPRAGIAAIVLSPLLAACGGEPELASTGDAPSDTTSAPLVGTEWQLLETSVGDLRWH